MKLRLIFCYAYRYFQSKFKGVFVFFLKLIAVITLVFVTACHSSPKAQPLSIKPETTHSETDLLKQQVSVDLPQSALKPEILYLLLIAETALQRDQYSTALNAYLKVSKQVDDVKIIEKIAKIALFLEDLAKTEEAVLRWLKKDSENTTARGIALTVALNKKDLPAAIEHLNVILKNYPADFNELLLKMQQALKSDADIRFSEKLLNALERQHPQQAIIFLSQSILAARQQDFEKAQQKVAHALTLQPKWEKAINLEAELWMYLGKQAFKNKNFTDALNAFKKIKHEKLQLDASIAIISVLFEQKNFNEANTRLDKLLKEKPEQRLRILLMKAELQNEQQNYQKAFEILTLALEESPMERKLLYSRSLIAEKLNDLITLESDLRKILQQDPEDVAALNALGYTLVDKTTRYAEAERYLEQALSLQPEKAVIIDSYGWLKFKQGDLQAALKYLQQAHEKLTGENEIVVHLAEVLWQLNKKVEARQLIDEEMKKSPDDDNLLEFKTRVLDKELR